MGSCFSQSGFVTGSCLFVMEVRKPPYSSRWLLLRGKFRLSVCRFINPLFDAALCRSTPIHHMPDSYTKTRTTLFLLCTKSYIAWSKIGVWRSFRWRSIQRKKSGNFTWYQEVSGFLIANFKFAVHSDSSYGRVRKAVQTCKEDPFHSRLAQRCRRIGTYQLFRRPSGCAERETPSGVSIAISTATAARQLTVMVMLGGWLFIIA